MLATKLSSALVAPSKVASKLDWTKAFGSVLGIDITRERIGLAVVEHPEHNSEPIPLISIPLRDAASKKSVGISKSALSELESIVRKHHVCASVVNWPVHQGRMGEQ
jgi:RNase H-fold protein (predicted Holliday junction resolvase)